MMVVVPTFGDSQGAVNRGFAMLELEEWSGRKRTSMEITAELRKKLAGISSLKVRRSFRAESAPAAIPSSS